MSISVSASSSIPQTPPPAQSPSTASSDTTSKYAKAPDGDYLQANNLSQQTPDATGGYKPLSSAGSTTPSGSASSSSSTAATASPAATSSSAVQSALTTLVKGG